MNLVVVGMGYVGIPVAALFADKPGFKVTGIQRRSKRSAWKIDYLNQGKSPIEANEPGLSELIERVVKKGTFHVTDDTEAYRQADAIIIAVQTPVNEKHQPQYESLIDVVEDIGSKLNKGTLVCVESTVAPGTTDNLVKPILEKQSGLKAGVDFNLVFSYERVMVGRLLHNLINYSRIIGGYTPECAERGVLLYKNIVEAELFKTDTITAEVSKVVENTYRDVNIAFANEVALICESLGVNVYEVRKFVNNLPNDPKNPSANPYRNMHMPGAGVGGHCLPKDPWLLKYGLDTYGEKKFPPKIIVESRNLNDRMPEHMMQLTLEALKENKIEINEARIAILGFAFLENSDDPRNTPALPLYQKLKKTSKEVMIHDPYIKEYEEIVISNDLEESIKNKDALLIVTRHKEYTELNVEKTKILMKTPIIIDGRNTLNFIKFRNNGFTFKGIGLP